MRILDTKEEIGIESNLLNEIINCYSQITKCDEEIAKIDTKIADSFDKLKSALGEVSEEQIPELDALFKKLKDMRASILEQKEKYIKDFIRIFEENFHIGISYQDGALICVNRSSESKGYSETLDEYRVLLSSEGFDDDDSFKVIRQKQEELSSRADILESVINTITHRRLENKGFLAALDISALWDEMGTYDELDGKYEDFLNTVNDEAQRIFFGETLDYILQHTSMIHLAYTNNNSAIKGKHSKYRYFECQIHHEKTPSMKVSLKDNYFQCYGCYKEGNTIDYLMAREFLPFDQAAYLLAEIYLLDIPDNPYKFPENRELVVKYRNSLISQEYMQFLLKTYDEVKGSLNGADDIFGTAIMQIERIKKGETDPDFVFNPKPKKFMISEKKED